MFFILRNNYRRAYLQKNEVDETGEKIKIELDEDVTFLNKGSIAKMLGELPDNSNVVIDGIKSHTIDIDVLEMLHDFKATAKLKNINLELKNIPEFKGVAGH